MPKQPLTCPLATEHHWLALLDAGIETAPPQSGRRRSTPKERNRAPQHDLMGIYALRVGCGRKQAPAMRLVALLEALIWVRPPQGAR